MLVHRDDPVNFIPQEEPCPCPYSQKQVELSKHYVEPFVRKLFCQPIDMLCWDRISGLSRDYLIIVYSLFRSLPEKYPPCSSKIKCNLIAYLLSCTLQFRGEPDLYGFNFGKGQISRASVHEKFRQR